MHPTKNTPQDLGSAITYQRRYAVGAILSLNIDEDDDGNNSSGRANGVGSTNGRAPQNNATAAPRNTPKTASDMRKEWEAEIEKAPDLDTLEKVWKKWANFHEDADFKTAMKDRKQAVKKALAEAVMEQFK